MNPTPTSLTGTNTSIQTSSVRRKHQSRNSALPRATFPTESQGAEVAGASWTQWPKFRTMQQAMTRNLMPQTL